MRIQGLIRELEQLKKKHGNLPVYLWDPDNHCSSAKEVDIDFHKEVPVFITDGWTGLTILDEGVILKPENKKEIK